MLLSQLLLLNDLKAFSSFREAAATLNLPESTIRSKVHQLEQALGCTLITRTHKGFHWTPTGQQILPHVKNLNIMVSELQRLHYYLSDAFSQKTALVSNTQFGTILLTKVISKTLQSYPLAQFSLSMLSNQMIVHSLLKSPINIALLQIHEIEEPPLQTILSGLPLSIEALLNDRVCFLIGPKHPLAHKKNATLREIMQTSRLVNKDLTDSLTQAFFQRHGYQGSITQLSNIISMRSLISKSNYISWQSYQAAKNSLTLYQDNLKILHIHDFEWRSTLFCARSNSPTFEENFLFDQLQSQISHYV